MERTRSSLFYVAGYLIFGGAGLSFAPSLTLSLFLSQGVYSDIMVRFVGVLMLALAVIIIQIIRLRVEKLYSTTVAVRFLFLSALAVFFLLTTDPLFLVLFAIIAIGVATTLACLLLDHQSRT